MVLFLLTSLFFVQPVPPEMPRAESFLVKKDNTLILEDRYDVRGLWFSRSLLGYWQDNDGRIFTVAKFSYVPPLSTDNSTKTRSQNEDNLAKFEKKEIKIRDDAISRFSLFTLPEKPKKPRHNIPHFKEVLYYEGTNTSAIVCSFLPEESENWYFASWQILEDDDIEEKREQFEDEFLRKWDEIKNTYLRSEIPQSKKSKKKEVLSERDLFKRDVTHSVTNYLSWHSTEADKFIVLDNLINNDKFIISLTNDLQKMYSKYEELFKSDIDITNTLCVARIFSSREEYLNVVDEDMKWSAAYWSPVRRELVAYLPFDGEAALLRTIRHEAFHQYMSYATSFFPVSPWLNEGYAQYFEDVDSDDWGLKKEFLNFEKLSLLLPDLFKMNLEEFYSGTDAERFIKYRLAWSVAYFLEKGAPNIRFQPYANLKRDYMASLLKTHDSIEATAAAFGNQEKLIEFIKAWLKFYTD